jgi:Fibronectin type III domain/FG-GAP-like repeat
MKLARSRTSWFLAVTVNMILATSFLMVPAVNAATADTATPVLGSFSLSATQVTPGQQVNFSYVATDDSGSLGQLSLEYADSIGHKNTLTFDNPPVAGSVAITVPVTWANGLIKLSYLSLTDPTGNKARYARGTFVYLSPAGVTGPTTHALSFVPGDMTVSGSTVDVTVPTLVSLSTSGSPAGPGQTISVHYEAAEASGSLRRVMVLFRDQYQIDRYVTSPGAGPLPLSGVVDLVIPATWPNGAYALAYVILTDLSGNSSASRADGTVSVFPAGAQGPTTHAVDLGATTFVVSGSTADLTPPVLTRVTLTGGHMAPGGTATLSYSAESQDPLTSLSFTYRAQYGDAVVFEADPAKLSGTLPISFPAGSVNGPYVLVEVNLQDSAGNKITYQRDGTITQYPSPALGKHALDLPASDVFMGTLPSAPTAVSAHLRSGSAFIFWDPSTALGFETTGYTITAQPGGRTVTVSNTAGWAELTGLTNGTTYRFTVTATNGFGTGPASASVAATPMMSTNVFAAGDLSRDGHPDIIGLRPSTDPTDLYPTSFLYRGNGVGGFSWTTPLSLFYPGGTPQMVFSPDDVSGDGAPDMMVIDERGMLWCNFGDGHGGVESGGAGLGAGWGSMRFVFGPGDFSGDHKNDVLAVTASGDLYLHRSLGSLYPAPTLGQRIGRGWGNFLAVFSRGDFSGDGKNDIMAVSKDGGLYLYRGNGLGGFAAAGQRIGNGWGNFTSVFSPGDFSGDHRTDVMAVNTAGDLLLYRGNGRGGFAAAGQTIGKGWAPFR